MIKVETGLERKIIVYCECEFLSYVVAQHYPCDPVS